MKSSESIQNIQENEENREDSGILASLSGIAKSIWKKVKNVLGFQKKWKTSLDDDAGLWWKEENLSASASANEKIDRSQADIEFLKELTKTRKLKIVEGSITESPDEVDVRVNAANTELQHIGGVAKEMVRIGGKSIVESSEQIIAAREARRLTKGEAVTTPPGNLKAKHIIHAAVMNLGEKAMFEDVVRATANTLREAERLGCKSIAFPAFGTGAGGLDPIQSAEAIKMGMLIEKDAVRAIHVSFVIRPEDNEVRKAFQNIFEGIAIEESGDAEVQQKAA